MEKFNTDGIVIKTSVTGESDLIVFVLTRTRGIIRAFAKGARGMKNKLHAGSSLFAYCDFTVTEKNEVYHINEAAVKDIFFGLRGDIARLTLAQYFCEVLLKTLPDGEADEEYLNLTLRSLYYLSGETKPILQIKAVFELRMAAVSGYAPPVHACADCGAFQTDMMFFNCLTGELFCDRCGSLTSPAHGRNPQFIDLRVLESLSQKLCLGFSPLGQTVQLVIGFAVPYKQKPHLSIPMKMIHSICIYFKFNVKVTCFFLLSA